MARYPFRLPDIGEGVAEAEITGWHVSPGDTVEEDQSLVDVMTDKATVELTSPVKGVVAALHGQPGTMAAVGAVIVEFEVEDAGDATQAIAPAASAPEPAAPPPAAQPAPQAAPATRRRAQDLGIALQDVAGTGPEGRILDADLDRYLAQAAPSAPPAERHAVHEQPIIGLRRKIAERMQEAKRRIPHITYVEECDVTELEALRQDLNAHYRESRPKLTLLPFLIRALVQVLPDFPQINAHYDDEAGLLRRYEGVHVGIATQTPGGLMVPVLRHAEARDIWGCAQELARLAAAARSGEALREELSGSTITITSLGALGGVATTPVINHPEVAIIGPNRIVEKPVVQGPFVAVRKVMNLSSSFDHRIVDGYDAAGFIQAVKRHLEHPALLFMPRGG